jgi:GH24 family phage-related lysozyme (muramidase)
MFIAESVYPFLNEEFLAHEILNERLDINSIKDKVKKAAIIASLFLLTASDKGFKELPSKQEVQNTPLVLLMAKNPELTKSEVDEKFDDLFNLYFWKEKEQGTKLNYDILQDPLILKTSNNGLNFIRGYEKLYLEAYEMGDGMITIGWGHAEPVGISKYVIGQKISKYEAERLFKKDIKKTEDGIRRLFKKWMGQGLVVQISQSMWDSMISMAFNMGVNGLRGSDIVQALKQEDYLTAADSILTTNTDDKFPGLEPRREAEKKLFLKGLI